MLAIVKVQLYLKHRFIGAVEELNKIEKLKKGEAIQKLTYLVKQRKDSIEFFNLAKRNDLADKE